MRSACAGRIQIQRPFGRLIVYSLDDGVTALTDFGIENLQQTIADLGADGRAPPRKQEPT